MNELDKLLAFILVTAIGFGFFLLVKGNEANQACAASGGTLVTTYEGYKCLKREVIHAPAD